MWKITKSWSVIAILAVLTSWATANEVIVSNRMITVSLNHSANLTCEMGNRPVLGCYYERNFANGVAEYYQGGNNASYLLTSDKDRGICNLQIKSVQEKDAGIWKCQYTVGAGPPSTGTMNITILKKPSTPGILVTWFENDNTRTVQIIDGKPETQPKKATCYSTNGTPSPKFEWFIDDAKVVDGLGPLNQTTAKDGQLYTFQELHNPVFRSSDNGKKLRCVAVHEAFNDGDNNAASWDIKVEFIPRAVSSTGSPVSDKNVRVQADLGEDKVISMNISSNPAPTVVYWVVDGKQLNVPSRTEKYETRMENNGTYNYKVTLSIKSVQEVDVSKSILLKLGNNAGTAEYSISINSADGPDGLSSGAVLGIVLAVLFAIIILTVVIVISRAKGLFCFKGDDGTASEKERMDGESTGAAPADEKPPTVGFASRLSALYENLVKKKDKGSPVPVDEEAAKDSKEKESEEGKDVEKKVDDIVYAELDLARSAEQRGEIVRSDDKTEYAEIVGVVSKGDAKTPEGSPKK